MTDTRMVTEPDDLDKILQIDRTDEQVGDEEAIMVSFGEGNEARTYPIVPAKRVDARKFRRALNDIRPTAQALINIASAAVAEKGVKDVQLADMVDVILVAVSGDLDKALDMIFLYSPILKVDEEWINNNGDDKQFAHALMSVFKVAFGPFGRVLGLNSLKISQLLPSGLNGEQKESTLPTDSMDTPEDGSVLSEKADGSQTK